MADKKPDCVHTCTISDCTPINPTTEHWFDFHMPCWICNTDKPELRHSLMWFDEGKVFFHSDCINERNSLTTH